MTPTIVQLGVCTDVSFNKRVMGVGLSGWCVGANVHVFVTDINVSNGELGGRAINRYSCVLLLVCYVEREIL